MGTRYRFTSADSSVYHLPQYHNVASQSWRPDETDEQRGGRLFIVRSMSDNMVSKEGDRGYSGLIQWTKTGMQKGCCILLAYKTYGCNKK